MNPPYCLISSVCCSSMVKCQGLYLLSGVFSPSYRIRFYKCKEKILGLRDCGSTLVRFLNGKLIARRRRLRNN